MLKIEAFFSALKGMTSQTYIHTQTHRTKFPARYLNVIYAFIHIQLYETHNCKTNKHLSLLFESKILYYYVYL